MFSMPLFLKEIRANYKLFLIFFIILAMYVVMVIPLYDPKMSESLIMFEKLMPEIMAAVGMIIIGDDLVSFLVSYLFGFLFILFPMIYSIMLINHLFTRYIDNGSMSFLLASPNSRTKIITTQIITTLLSLFILIMTMAIIGIVVSEMMFVGELDIGLYLKLHLAIYGLQVFIIGIIFFTTTLFSEAKQGTLVGVSICIVMYLLKMLANIGEGLAIFKNITFFTLFDERGLLQASSDAFLKIIFLYIGGLILLVISVKLFKKSNLSI